MRVSTSQIHQQAAAQISRLGQETSATQQRIASGRQLLKPGDDPLAAARILQINQDIALREQFLNNTATAETALAQEDSIISQVMDSLHRVQELTIQAGDAALGAEDRGFLAAELSARADEMVALLNSKGADGNYLFSGYQGNRQPFVLQGDQMAFVGDDGGRELQIDRSASVRVGISGQRLFESIMAAQVVPWVQSETQEARVVVNDQELFNAFSPENLNITYQIEPTTGQTLVTATRVSDGRIVDGVDGIVFSTDLELPSIGLTVKHVGQPGPDAELRVDSSPSRGLLNTVRDITAQLRSPQSPANNDQDSLRGLLDTTLTELSNAMNNMLGVQAEVGATQNAVSSTADLHRTIDLQAKQALSSLRDVDFAEAVSELNYQAFLLEAAQQSFVRINNLSLFNAL